MSSGPRLAEPTTGDAADAALLAAFVTDKPEELAAVAAESGWELRDATDGLIYAAELRPRQRTG